MLVSVVDVERNRAMLARVASAKPGDVIEVDTSRSVFASMVKYGANMARTLV